MTFQTSVPTYPAPAVPGAKASLAPVYPVTSGPGSLVAGPQGLTVGNFAWVVTNPATGQGVAQAGVTGNTINWQSIQPDGFLGLEQQGLITTFLADASMIVPAGLPVTLYDRGDFWARCATSQANIGQKVFANLFTGAILAGAAGSFQTPQLGSNFAGQASFATNVMTVTSVTSGVLAVGHLVSGAGIPPGTYITSLGTGTGGTGTYNLSTYPGTIAAEAITTVAPVGGPSATGTASFATNVMTVTAVSAGAFAVGQLVQSAGVAAGTYISSLGTGTGGTGTYNLSTTPGTISAQAVAASSWVETPWYVNSNGNPGDLIKIGVRN